MLITCPHCHTRILPSKGMCPACGKPTEGQPESPWAQLTVKDGSGLPDLCCICCAPATRHVKVKRGRRLGGENPIILFITFLFGILLGGARMLRALSSSEVTGTRQALQVVLPLCADHEAPEPDYVSFEQGYMVFKVSKAFEAVARLKL